MEKYSIFCSEEQTRKALELGAPINIRCSYNGYYPLPFIREIIVEPHHFAEVPTTEQMIGWLEDQGIWIHFCRPNQRPNLLSFSVSNINEPFRREFVGGEYSSRREATITAIDAALDYLVKIKEEKE